MATARVSVESRHEISLLSSIEAQEIIKHSTSKSRILVSEALVFKDLCRIAKGILIARGLNKTHWAKGRFQ
jgi:hypothetical protein